MFGTCKEARHFVTPPKMWSELSKDERGKIKLWKVYEMGRTMNSRKSIKGRKNLKKIDQENYRKCPEKQPEREKNPEKFQCCELEAEIEKGGTVEKGEVKEEKKFLKKMTTKNINCCQF
jgi:hypothetical protein